MTQNITLAPRDRSLAETARQHFGEFDRTHQGVAEAFADFTGGLTHYVLEDECWAAFTGHRWEFDASRTFLAMFWERFVQARIANLPNLSGSEQGKELELIGTLNGQPRFRNDVFELCKPKLAVPRKMFDQNCDHLLVTPAGVVDLRTGTIAPHDPRLYLTQCTAIAPDATVPCPTFQGLLFKLANDDPETTRWLWRFFGYILTGDVRFDALLYLRGQGSNGKSTAVKTLDALLGDYAVKVNIDALTTGKEVHTTELEVVRGKRLVYTSEIAKGMRLKENIIKDLTGGDVHRPRNMHQSARAAEKWDPKCKLVLYGNHDLRIYGTDEGIWRRIRKVESSHTFPQGNGVRDAMATTEGPGILAWLISAAVEVYQYGLPTPAAVQQTTSDYRESQDVLAGFFDLLCFEENATVSKSELSARYATWCAQAAQTGDRMPSLSDMTETLKARPGVTLARPWSNETKPRRLPWQFTGVRLA